MRKGESRLEYENHIKTNEKVKCVRKCKGVLQEERARKSVIERDGVKECQTVWQIDSTKS